MNQIGRGVLSGTLLFYSFIAFSQNSPSIQSISNVWRVVRENAPKTFPKTVPPGNYSGITHLHDDVYAVVSDKSDSALFFNFRIQVNPKTGDLEHVENLGFTERVDAGLRGFDHEAIAKVTDSTVVVASEGYCSLKEYPIRSMAAPMNGRKLWNMRFPSKIFYPNYNFESLAFDSVRKILWTIPESTLRPDGIPSSPEKQQANKLRLMAFDWRGLGQSSHLSLTLYAYQMDKPTTNRKAATYVMGVSELCVLPDGQLLVLEREAFVPKIKLGAFCKCKLYVINPLEGDSIAQYDASESISQLDEFAEHTPILKKRLLTEWKTGLSLFDRSFANFEGMCLGPKLEDGSQVLILLSDSQDQYAGVLKDWFKTIIIKDLPGIPGNS